MSEALTERAIGLRLCRMAGEALKLCEPVLFQRGREGVELVLRRAAISGRVEIEGPLEDYWADVLVDENGAWDQTVALDAKSYGALKNRWMRCRLQQKDRP